MKKTYFGRIVCLFTAIVFMLTTGTLSEETTTICLSDEAINVDGAGAEADGSVLKIVSGGTYLLTGLLENGKIVIDAGKNAEVTLILADVSIRNSKESVIEAGKIDTLTLKMQNGTVNSLISGTKTDVLNAGGAAENASGGTVDVKCTLKIEGNGSLFVGGYLNSGIHTSRKLTVKADDGTVTVEALQNGIVGKKGVTVKKGTLNITAGNDGIKSNLNEDGENGAVTFEGGRVTVNSMGDAVSSTGTIDIKGGVLQLITGGGCPEEAAYVEKNMFKNRGGRDKAVTQIEEVSCKAVKADGAITVSGGSVEISSRDDGIHSDDRITVRNGNLIIRAGDDGIHADNEITLSGGDIDIRQSYEGIEAYKITVENGNVSVRASDDGMNANGGDDGGFGFGYPRRGRNDSGEIDTTLPQLIVTGGSVLINADGDGLDSNGNLLFYGGSVIVDGPESSWNGALDSGMERSGVCRIFGGTVLAIGASGMAESFDSASEQAFISVNTAVRPGSRIVIGGEDGTELMSYTALKSASNIVFSAPAITAGEKLTVTVDENVQTVTAGTSDGNGRRFRGR